ncbi:hypothetical protein FA95DRAFT_1276695 [Auriscalpium vulgare]|uniref:Uncharacterized protein n=1 Tax=Auriscalpium vulgare TaxID=40419 RepID=A0ACB8RUI1_9AGAM|nr:hypothetical protein FA95DRAFT_1276695 [Auriscalpium vulgare]
MLRGFPASASLRIYPPTRIASRIFLRLAKSFSCVRAVAADRPFFKTLSTVRLRRPAISAPSRSLPREVWTSTSVTSLSTHAVPEISLLCAAPRDISALRGARASSICGLSTADSRGRRAAANPFERGGAIHHPLRSPPPFRFCTQNRWAPGHSRPAPWIATCTTDTCICCAN